MLATLAECSREKRIAMNLVDWPAGPIAMQETRRAAYRRRIIMRMGIRTRLTVRSSILFRGNIDP